MISSMEDVILIVDDAPQNLTVLGHLLQSEFRVRAANSGERALKAAQTEPRPSLIMLDIMMPDMDGYAVIAALKANPETHAIPVIFITAMSDSHDEEHGLTLGAVDYITKPFRPAIVLARVRAQLELKHSRDRLEQQNDWLEQEVAKRMSENILIQELNIRALACLAEARDNETGRHIIRTQSYVAVLGEYLIQQTNHAPELTPEKLQQIIKAAPLHDIGKVGIADAILLKPDRLTPAEFDIMKTHTTIGSEAIRKAISQALAANQLTDTNLAAVSFLQMAEEIAHYHHEKWDGSGYPAQLSGESIPIGARLMALADVYDALVSRRVYKEAWSFSEANQWIELGKGLHFDPQIVDAFLACSAECEAIARLDAD
ncbi:MAG: response regulator [Deefgea sp.]